MISRSNSPSSAPFVEFERYRIHECQAEGIDLVKAANR